MALDSLVALLGGILGGGSTVWLWQTNKLNQIQERLEQSRQAQRQAESITAQHTKELADLERTHQQQIRDLKSEYQLEIANLTQAMNSKAQPTETISNEDAQLFPFDDLLGEKEDERSDNFSPFTPIKSLQKSDDSDLDYFEDLFADKDEQTDNDFDFSSFFDTEKDPQSKT